VTGRNSSASGVGVGTDTLATATALPGGTGEHTFDPDRDDQTVQIDTIEDWTVINSSPMDHSFHLRA
jgi:FtsP/CotA-like multicopper oxidase with cupredoxin domain